MSMKEGFALIVGKCVDMAQEDITTKRGDSLVKLSVAIKPSAEASPIECELWGEQALQFQRDELILETLIIKASLVGREWKTQDGEVRRRVSIRIREWEVFGREEEGADATGDVVKTTDVPF